MLTLYHTAFDPFSRKVRMMLWELGVDFDTQEFELFCDRSAIQHLNPSGEFPVLLINETEEAFCGHYVITEAVQEIIEADSLFGDKKDYMKRAEVRRLMYWFDSFFYTEVTQNLFGQKLIDPNSNVRVNPSAIRAGYKNIKRHFDYMQWLLDRNVWLAGSQLSLADISAAVQISLIDYVEDISWNDYKRLKGWYQVIKSRPSFQKFLLERIPSYSPRVNYTKLDF